jgi:hypothetical protein
MTTIHESSHRKKEAGMSALRRFALPLIVLIAAAPLVKAQDVDNPYYTFWSKSKPGATVELKETTKLSGAAAASAPDATDVKFVTYKLLELNAKEAVVEARVKQEENFGYVETAPTKQIYPAKMSKAVLADLIAETGAKSETGTLKVGDKEMKVRIISGNMKKGDEDIDFKIWVSDDVPGGIVKRQRTTKMKGEVVADTAVEVLSYKTGG